MDHTKRKADLGENEEPRKPFVAPKLKQYEKLPEITGFSGCVPGLPC